jgi:predicted nucleic-acid-binding protein
MLPKTSLRNSKFVDTNIFLEIFIRRGRKSDACKKLLRNRQSLWTNDLVISEIEWILRSGFSLKRPTICLYLGQIINDRHLHLPFRRLLLSALSLYQNSSLDWIDCLNSVKIKRHHCYQIYSYDRHFSKIPNLIRLEP